MKKGKKKIASSLFATVVTVGILGSFLLGNVSPIRANDSLYGNDIPASSENEEADSESFVLPLVGDDRSVTALSSSTYSTDFDYGVSYKSDSDPNWGKIENATTIVHVYNWTQLHKAVVSGTATADRFVAADGVDPVDGVAYSEKNNADYIVLMNDIIGTSFAIGVARQNSPATRPDYVIDGNGFKLDSGARSFGFPEKAAATAWQTPNNVYVKNITMYSTNPYGAFMGPENSYNFYTITYEDVNYIGSQLTASWTSTLIFRGTNHVESTNSYTMSYENVNNTGVSATVTRPTYTNQSGLEAHRVIFDKDSVNTFDIENGDGLLIGGYLSNNVANGTNGSGRAIPYAAVRENADVTMTSKGNSGESYSYNAGTSGVMYAGINIQNGGQLYVGENADLLMNTAGTTRAGMRLTASTAAVNAGRRPVATIASGGNLQFNMDGNMNTGTYYSGFFLEGYATINVAESGHLGLSMKNEQNGKPAIRMDANSTVNIGSEGLLKVDMDNSIGSAMQLGTSSKFDVEALGQAAFTLSNQGGASSNVINVAGGTFTIGKKGIFDLKVADGTAARNMFSVSSGSFTFADAYRVDLDAQGNDNVNIVNMNGSFNADIQAVYAWNKGNQATAKENSDFDWTPIYNAKVTYSGANTTAVTANSVSTTTKNSFQDNYRTQNFNRVV
ncbi:pectate lyase-like adhesive domain-containing protein [Enterococcus sp. BWR-S5]|uniref:pectate lyase-like adhesive domain-containing protein n=1 Tax=Enterococcus sp. BWR-S5 TaxID=2787714 RepID=UPI001921540A|nr:pectate lyase-like adhesive domain-containing protein [Enterococcus sp. BWR-S5]MBL1225824.1 hypothetical protein [Enterococcus sp. BWR-S5]